MILLDVVAQLLALTNADRLRRPAGSILQPVLAFAGNDCLTVRLASVDDNSIWSTMALQGFPEEAFGCRHVRFFTKEERCRDADAVDGAV